MRRGSRSVDIRSVRDAFRSRRFPEFGEYQLMSLRSSAKWLLTRGPLHLAVGLLRPKPIFQIGFNKCGTTSLHMFFLDSGIRSIHWAGGSLAAQMAARMNAGEDPIRDYPQFVGFTDMTAIRAGKLIEPNKRFDYLHRWYPDALFILNTRDRENWIASRAAHFTSRGSLLTLYAQILSIPERDVRDFWRAEWKAHHALVRAYFARAHNFLEFDIERDLPAKLVSFISRHYPQCATASFGRHNQTPHNQAAH